MHFFTVSEGTLHAKARVVHRSRQLFLADAELFDDQSRQIARAAAARSCDITVRKAQSQSIKWPKAG